MRRDIDFSAIFPVDRGFTLVEMIISIVITGIVVSMVAIFGRNQINAYIDVGNRAELSDAADTALRRIARDLQSALPNSVRNASAGLLEFVPIHDAGRYRAELSATGTGNVLDFSNSGDNSFDVLGPTVTVLAGDQLVIFNLGQSGSDVYDGTSSRAATAGVGLSTLSFTSTGTQFPLASPNNRFQIVGAPVTYECSGTQLLRRRSSRKTSRHLAAAFPYWPRMSATARFPTRPQFCSVTGWPSCACHSARMARRSSCFIRSPY